MPLFAFAFLTFGSITFADTPDSVSSDLELNSKTVDCTSCGSLPSDCMLLCGESSGEILASEVWEFFHSQGQTEVSSFRLFLDVPMGASVAKAIEIESLALEIYDARGNLVSESNLGEQKLVIASSRIHQESPEVQVQMPLGFDFMKKFNSASTELISFRLSSASLASSDAKVFLASPYQPKISFGTLTSIFGFIAFWGIVFATLNWVTRPSTVESSQPTRATKQEPIAESQQPSLA
ncbi:MAG: hypothetical protein AAF623_12950 [Planctomycetota bacterium]